MRRPFSTAPGALRKIDCATVLPWPGVGDGSAFRRGTVLMLNSPTALPRFFDQLWSADAFRACADGAVNRLFERPRSLPPHVVVGDFDSARPQVLRHYELLGTAVVKRPSTDTTDLQKLLSYDAVDDARRHSGGATAVLGGLGGYLSHQLANLSEAVAQAGDPGLGPLFFVGDDEVCFVLGAGETRMRTPFRLNCSLVPLAGCAHSVTTTGLQWNLTRHRLEVGRFISTSNFVAEDVVTVATSHALLFVIDARTEQHTTKCH